MKNLKAIKSTILGIALIIFSSFLIYKNISHDYYINGALYFMGIMFLFTGDSWVNKLQEFVFGFLNKKNNNNNQTPNE